MSSEAKCPFHHSSSASATNRDWWPNQLNLNLLHQHSSLSDPMGEGFQLCGGVQEPRLYRR